MKSTIRHRANGATLFAIIGLGLLSGCASTPAPRPGSVVEDPAGAINPFPTSAAAQNGLRPADVISVTVFQEPDLSIAQVPISGDGTISVPLAGRVQAAGLSPAELAAVVKQKLAPYLIRPEVTVNVIDYQYFVTVDGGVEQPGVFKFQPGMRLSGAISMARGPSRVAKIRQVAIFREDAQGQSVALFDYQLVRAGRQIDPVIMPNDRVVVGISGLSQGWQDFLSALPALAVFTRL